MRDYIDIAGAPCGEPCVQFIEGQDSSTAARKECELFIDQLERQFPNLRCTLWVKSNRHDFGVYYQVVAYYWEDDEGQREDAFMLESNTPENWDETAQPLVAALRDQYPNVTWGG